MAYDVVVVGSLNHDLSVRVPRHPRPGETILGHGHHRGPGGKGANQAVAAAKLGASVGMVGKIGTDREGEALLEALASAGVDISHVVVDTETPSGLALITVDEEGENSIVVVPGANGRLTPADLDPGLLRDAPVVLVQLEIPLQTVAAAAEACIGILVLNPAPAHQLPSDLLERTDVLVPNRGELGILAGIEAPQDRDQVKRAVERIPTRQVVVTLGSEGVIVCAGGDAVAIPAPKVEAVDTTGAGDAFCAALALRLGEGDDLVAAARWAVAAGALATTRLGAQAAMPRRAEVEALVGGSD